MRSTNHARAHPAVHHAVPRVALRSRHSCWARASAYRWLGVAVLVARCRGYGGRAGDRVLRCCVAHIARTTGDGRASASSCVRGRSKCWSPRASSSGASRFASRGSRIICRATRPAVAASSSSTGSSAIAASGTRGCVDFARHDIPFVAVSLEPLLGSIDDYRPTIATAVRRVERATGLAPVVVAHSMGGLAVRAWLGRSTPNARCHRLVTIASPHARHSPRRPWARPQRRPDATSAATGSRNWRVTNARPRGRSVRLLLEPLRQHRLSDPQRDSGRRRQPPSRRDAARRDGLPPAVRGSASLATTS